MTPIGHTLTGLAFGTLAMPRETPRKQKVIFLAVFAVLASLPDLPFPYWGHARYEISHSIIVTVVASTTLALVLAYRYRGRWPFTASILVCGVLAWCSHILLDTLYNHAIGLPVLWPFGLGRVALPIPWLSTGDRVHIFSWHNVSVAVFEILTFGPLLMLAVLVKSCNLFRSRPADTHF